MIDFSIRFRLCRCVAIVAGLEAGDAASSFDVAIRG
jgi:hypothetical protein